MERIIRENHTSEVIQWGELFGVKPDLSNPIPEEKLKRNDAIIDEVHFPSVLGKGLVRFIKDRAYYEEPRAGSLVTGLEEPLTYQVSMKDGQTETDLQTLPIHIEIEFEEMTSKDIDSTTVILSYKDRVFHTNLSPMDPLNPSAPVEERVYPTYSSDWIDSKTLKTTAIAAACTPEGEKQIEAVRFAFIRTNSLQTH